MVEDQIRGKEALKVMQKTGKKSTERFESVTHTENKLTKNLNVLTLIVSWKLALSPRTPKFLYSG